MKVILPPTHSSAWDKYIPRVSDRVEPGFQSAAEIAKLQGLGRDHTAKILHRLAAAGKIEVKPFRMPGSRAPVLHYRQYPDSPPAAAPARKRKTQ